MATSSLIANRSFLGLATAQFLGAANDNLFRMVVSLFAIQAYAEADGDSYLLLTPALFAAPYLVFSSYAGHLADILSKRTVMIACKAFEILIMAAGLAVLVRGARIEGLIFVLFLVATHSTFFSPSKYGSVPEIVKGPQLPRANGIMEAAHHTAIIVGTAVGGTLMDAWKSAPNRIGVATIAIAVAGLLCSLAVKPLPPACVSRPWPRSPFSGCWRGLRRLSKSRSLLVAAASLAFFDGIAMLVLLDILFVVKVEIGVGDGEASAVAAFAAVGTLLGALACGYLCRSKIELGITPIAGLGIAAGLFALSVAPSNYWAIAAFLFILGVFAGLFIVPFWAWLEKRPKRDEKGLVISTATFIDMAVVFVMSVGLWYLQDWIGFAPRAVLLVSAVMTALYVLGVLVSWRRLKSRVALFLRSFQPQLNPQ